MPANLYNPKTITAAMPLITIQSSTYAINGGSALAAGASTTSDTITATGVATTDKRIGISPRDGTVIPYGLTASNIFVSATNTVSVTWTNNTTSAITPPATAVWSVVVLGNYTL
jgi:hypothetical protein